MIQKVNEEKERKRKKEKRMKEKEQKKEILLVLKSHFELYCLGFHVFKKMTQNVKQ